MRRTMGVGICAAAVFLAACYGPFRLTRKVYDWNSSLDPAWAKEALFLLLNAVPVYGFVMLADTFVFNPLEFLGQGGRPAEGTLSRVISHRERQAVITCFPGAHRMRVDLFRNHRPSDYFIIERNVRGEMTACDRGGKIFMTVRSLPDGSIAVFGPDGCRITVTGDAVSREALPASPETRTARVGTP